MIEKRKSKRIPITVHLSISDLYKEEHLVSGIHNLDAPIQIVDISTAGIAFITECVLPVGYYFNASLRMDKLTEKVFTVVRIVRSQVIDRSHYLYGCEFTNKPGNLANLLEQLADI